LNFNPIIILRAIPILKTKRKHGDMQDYSNA